VLDVPQLVETDPIMPRGQIGHLTADFEIGPDACLVHDERHPESAGLVPRELRKGAIALHERPHELDRCGQCPDRAQRPLDQAEAKAIGMEETPESPDEGGAHETIRRLYGGRLGECHGDGDVRREHHIDREQAVPWTHVQHEIVRRQRTQAREPTRLSPRPAHGGHVDGVVTRGQELEPGHARRHERGDDLVHPGRPSLTLSFRRVPPRRDAEVTMDVGPRRVAIDQDDPSPELREVDREVRRDEALPRAASPPPHGDDLRGLRGLGQLWLFAVGIRGERHEHAVRSRGTLLRQSSEIWAKLRART
jgi:hypothetical protein